MNKHPKEFSQWREFLWPIHSHELKKLLPMALMLFFFLFNYTIMRDTKDTLVLTAAGAEAIPFLKFWGTLPASILFVLLYARLSTVLSARQLFFTTLTPFLLFFGLFGFVLYPCREVLMPRELVEHLRGLADLHLPLSMQATAHTLLAVVQNWIYGVFYVLAELWGSMGVSLLFWQFANQITSTTEAKRFYPRFTQLGNLALVASGLLIVYFSDMRATLSADTDAWGLTLKWLMASIVLGCMIIMAAYAYVSTSVPEAPAPTTTKKKKVKMGVLDSFRYLSRSKYLGAIALLVFGYGMTVNLIEVVYKSQLKLQFPTANELSTFVGYISVITGVVTFFLVTFSGYIVRNVGWFAAAITTPVLMLATGAVFFTMVEFREALAITLNCSPIWLAVLIGAFQNVISKGTKYCLFDPTKEMAYIPLDEESKIKGKAAIDVVGARMGKSGGGLALQFVLLFGSIMQNLPVLFGMVLLVASLWIWGVLYLRTAKPSEEEETSPKTSPCPVAAAAG